MMMSTMMLNRSIQQRFLLFWSLFLSGIITNPLLCTNNNNDNKCYFVVDAAKKQSHSPSEFGNYWKDSQIIMETLNEYQALWIKVHNCV